MVSKTFTEEADCGICQSCVQELDLASVVWPVVTPSVCTCNTDCDGNSQLELMIEDLLSAGFSLQADDVVNGTPAVGTSEGQSISEMKQTTMAFLENTNGYSAGLAADLPSAATSDEVGDVSLNEFLSRPVQIASVTWTEAASTGVAFSWNPWTLFFSNTYIKNKLANYAWIKCDMKLKIMVNASPFYYGAALFSYAPLPNFHPNSITAGTSLAYIIPYSQRPHIWVYPQNNEGGELQLPFLYQQNWIPTLKASNFDDMGRLSMVITTPLAQANGVSGSGVTVTIYAWAENVVLSGPSVGLTMQAKDEYGTGPVSSVASAIATVAGRLSDMPVIGRFMTATQIGASATSQIASKFGYCNTPVISETQPFRPTPLPVLASTEQGYPIEKLTIDPKNELTVDPSFAGLPSVDELSISHLVQRESYLTQFTWTTSNVTDDLLFSAAVTPTQFVLEAGTNPLLQFTPSGWLSQMFSAWRGDMIFRFRFICSQYHRGRVRIVFDPSGDSTTNILNTVNTQSVCFNEIVDLTKDTNVEVRVPYSQALAWCRTIQPTSGTSPTFTVGSGTTFLHAPPFTNGMLAVRCVTALTAPVASSTVYCLVSVRGADNLEFAKPDEVYKRYSTFAPQALDLYDDTAVQSVIAGNKPSRPAPERYLINYGENIVSLRQLARRYMLTQVITQPAPSASSLNSTYVAFYRMPRGYGFDPNGVENVKGLVAPLSNFNFNMTPNTYLSWIAMCFVGYRGAVNWTVNTVSTDPITHLSVSRVGGSNAIGTTNSSIALAGLSASGAANFAIYTSRLYNWSGCGSAVTNQRTNACVNISHPNYSRYKFNVTTTGNFTTSIQQDDVSEQTLRLHVVTAQNTATPFSAQLFCAAGTDWTCIFFLNVPTLWQYSADPTPN